MLSQENPVDLERKAFNVKFRSWDVRWDKAIRTVKYLMKKPDQPSMNFLDGNKGNLQIEQVGYTRNQLQKKSKQEEKVEHVEPLCENAKYKKQQQEKGGINDLNEMMYSVKSKGVKKANRLKRESLVEGLGASYINRLDKRFDKEQNN